MFFFLLTNPTREKKGEDEDLSQSMRAFKLMQQNRRKMQIARGSREISSPSTAGRFFPPSELAPFCRVLYHAHHWSQDAISIVFGWIKMAHFVSFFYFFSLFFCLLDQTNLSFLHFFSSCAPHFFFWLIKIRKNIEKKERKTLCYFWTGQFCVVSQ